MARSATTPIDHRRRPQRARHRGVSGPRGPAQCAASSAAHVLGGAAVTEEIVPGFRFSVASYVVSLLRPEIIRELDLPRHGLEILPLDGTFTPLDGDYLWRVNDHARTVRELRRWSLADAEAYEEYGRLMVQMARFIKPILSIVPPDQGRLEPARVDLRWGRSRSASRELPRRLKRHLHPADDDERGRLPRPVVRDRSAQGDDVGLGHHRHVPGRALAGHGLRAAAPLHGRDRRRLPRLGHPARRHRRRQPGDRVGARGRRAPRSAPRRRSPGSTSRAGGRPASRSSRARRSSAGAVLSSADSRRHLRAAGRAGRCSTTSSWPTSRRYKFRGSSGKVNLALDGLPDFTCLPGRASTCAARSASRPSVEYMERAYDDAKYGRSSAGGRTST